MCAEFIYLLNKWTGEAKVLPDFSYLSSAEKASWIASAVHDGRKPMDKSCQVYGNFHIGNHNMIAGRRAYIAVQCYQL